MKIRKKRRGEKIIMFTPILATLPLWLGDYHFVPMVFDADPRPFHGCLPYDHGEMGPGVISEPESIILANGNFDEKRKQQLRNWTTLSRRWVLQRVNQE